MLLSDRDQALHVDQLAGVCKLGEAVRAVRAWGMSEISVRALEESDWQVYREVRLAALQESPQAFVTTYAEAATQPEQYWRNCMVRAHRLLAELDGAAVGVASVEMIKGAPHSR